MTLLEDFKLIVEELEQEQQMSLISVELVENELACVYANSKKAEVNELNFLFESYIKWVGLTWVVTGIFSVFE